MISNFRDLWVRGADGAPAHVWVVRSAAFTAVLCAWSLFADDPVRALPSLGPLDLVLAKSTTILFALYLAYAARTRLHALVAVGLLAASAVTTYAISILQSRWIFSSLNAGRDIGSSVLFQTVSMASVALTIIPFWLAWSIARRHGRAWVWTFPVPLLTSVAFVPATRAYMQHSMDTGADVSAFGLWLMGAVAVSASILVAWAVDAIVWRRAGSPEWTEQGRAAPREPGAAAREIHSPSE